MTLTRRRFLVGGLQVTALAPALRALPGWPGGAPDPGERTLVVVQLTGGNDALNTLVPWRQDDYYRMRPALGLARGALHTVDDDHGLHPSMAGVGELFAEGQGAAVWGVGPPHPDRSHFRSMEIWHTAEPDAAPGEWGWLGRVAQRLGAGREGVLTALHIGGGRLPLALRSPAALAPTVEDERGFVLHERGARCAPARDALLVAGTARGDLLYLREAARSTYDAAHAMERLAREGAGAAYPNHRLARELALAARLIGGGFGTRVFYLTLGGFDTHARQGPVHAALLAELSESLTAFQRDLEARGAAGRVLTLVFSEFGRRAQENGSKGTDHGAGAPVFLLGGGVRGGLHGQRPDLGRLVDGDVPVTTDFRSVYATIERRWLGLAGRGGPPVLDFLA